MEFDLSQKLLSLLYSFMILFNALIIKKHIGTFLFPASIFCLFWFGYTFFPLIFLFNIPINSNAILFIYLCTLFFTIGSLPFKWKQAINQNSDKLNLYSHIFNNSFLAKSIIYLFILVMLCLIIDIYYQGFLITDFIFNFFESSNKFMVIRYEEAIIENNFSKIAGILNYSLVMLGGLFIYNIKKHYLFYILLILFPSIFITLTQAAKGTILLSIFLFYGGILLGRIYVNKLEITNHRTNKIVLLLILFLFVVMTISFLSRGLYELGFDLLLDKLLYYFNSYAFAHLYAFSDWFSFVLNESHIMIYQKHDEYFFGFYTFMSFFQALGSNIDVPHGVYEEYFNFKDIIQSNIYTFFRGTILDFGIFGSFLFFLLVGFVVSLIFFLLLVKKNFFIGGSIFIFTIGYCYTSFIISLMIWKSTIVAIFIVSLILNLNYYFIQKRTES